MWRGRLKRLQTRLQVRQEALSKRLLPRLTQGLLYYAHASREPFLVAAGRGNALPVCVRFCVSLGLEGFDMLDSEFENVRLLQLGGFACLRLHHVGLRQESGQVVQARVDALASFPFHQRLADPACFADGFRPLGLGGQRWLLHAHGGCTGGGGGGRR